MMSNTDFQRDLQNFHAGLVWALNSLDAHVREHLIDANMAAFQKILENEWSPNEEFRLLSNGCFKECYWPIDTDHFVIKFASRSNRTDEELEALQIAQQAGLDDFFVPTYAFKLRSCLLPAYVLGDSDSARYTCVSTVDSSGNRTYRTTYNEDWVCNQLNYVIIQPRVYDIIHDTHHHNTRFYDHAEYWNAIMSKQISGPFDNWFTNVWYPEHPLLINNEPWVGEFNAAQAFDMMRLSDHREWWQAMLNTYGEENTLDFVSFCLENDIHDLHDGNVGYTADDDARPIVLDWMSNQDDQPPIDSYPKI